jgi:Abnormal spindle-like microcephaly-assoc'd, ASPM-SPD-2-Hydin/Galactose oxidase, central domain/Kelch motif
MKNLCIGVSALLLTSLQPLSAQVQGQWVATGTMQTQREFHAQVSIAGGKALSIGGSDNSGNVLASVELYSSTSGKWTLTGSMAEARQSFPAVVLKNGIVLVSGGLGASGTSLNGAELYSPTTGTWSSAGALLVARYGQTATLLPNGKVLVSGGCTANGCGTSTGDSEIYDPTSNSWSTTGSLTTARGLHTAVLLKTGKVLAIGGYMGGPIPSCELYDPTKGTWSAAASSIVARYLNVSTLLTDGKVLATGGKPSRGPTNSAELYDPAANTWTLTGSMSIGRYGHTAGLLPDGTVVVAGGIGQSISCGKACTGYIPTNKVDIYNEAAGKFTATGGLGQALAYQSMSLLTNGRALESGGISTTATCCVVVNTAEVYTPLTLTLSSASLNFGLLQIGLTSPSQTVTVTNVSGHSVTFTSIASKGDYARTETCPTTLTAGQSCTITVTFTPTAAGTRTGSVTLKDNSPGSPTQTIALTGTGETLALGFTPASINFNAVLVGSSSLQSASLTNDGSAPVNITGIAISPADGTYTQTNNCPVTLAVQQTCTFQIVFAPPDVFTYNATLSIMNSAGGAASMALTGMGVDN